MTSELPSPRDGIAEAIAEEIRHRARIEPALGVVLGSGLGDAVRAAKSLGSASEGVELSYSDLPGFPPPTVPGHAGKLWIGELANRPVAVFQGRIHFYEGRGMPLSSITSRISALLGARAMLLTAAVGALDPALEGGHIVVVRDHLNFIGTNPLAGWVMPDGSPPFIDVAGLYDEELSGVALASAREHFEDRSSSDGDRGSPRAHEGIYAAVGGPSYETGAESEFLRRAGATVVGMSMVPEAVAAKALGMRVVGVSFVTNAAGQSVSHEEVLLASKTAAEAIGRMVVDLSAAL